MALTPITARIASAQPANENWTYDEPFPQDTLAPYRDGAVAEEEFDLTSLDLPDYRALFRIEAWLNNTLMSWPWDLSEPPRTITDLDEAIGSFVDAALEKEGLAYDQMLEAIHAGRFDRG